MKISFRRMSLVLAALLAAVCLNLSALAEDDISLDTLNPDDIEEVTMETPLISSPLPVDFSGGSVPQESGYLDDFTYEDPTISVHIDYKNVRTEYDPAYTASAPSYLDKKEIGVFVVDIRLGDASQLRTISNKSFSKNSAGNVLTIAGRVNPVVATNGDFATRRQEGLIIRQGTTYKNSLRGVLDVLAIDEDGDFHMFSKPKKGEVPEVIDGKKVLNAFYFGPILVDNGELPEKFNFFRFLEEDKYYCRVAICQIGPLHYKMILTTMQETASTTGLPLKVFAQICRDEGAQYAYNLDGGNSASLIFRGQLVNSSNDKKPREVPDIIYFASAWDGEAAE